MTPFTGLTRALAGRKTAAMVRAPVNGLKVVCRLSGSATTAVSPVQRSKIWPEASGSANTCVPERIPRATSKVWGRRASANVKRQANCMPVKTQLASSSCHSSTRRWFDMRESGLRGMQLQVDLLREVSHRCSEKKG